MIWKNVFFRWLVYSSLASILSLLLPIVLPEHLEMLLICHVACGLWIFLTAVLWIGIGNPNGCGCTGRELIGMVRKFCADLNKGRTILLKLALVLLFYLAGAFCLLVATLGIGGEPIWLLATVPALILFVLTHLVYKAVQPEAIKQGWLSPPNFGGKRVKRRMS